MVKEPSKPDVSPLPLLVSKMIESMHGWQTGNPVSSLKAVSEGMEKAKSSGVHVMDYLLLGNGVAASLFIGDIIGAGGYLQKMAHVIEKGHRMNTSFYYFLAAWEALLQGNSPLAYQ